MKQNFSWLAMKTMNRRDLSTLTLWVENFINRNNLK